MRHLGKTADEVVVAEEVVATGGKKKENEMLRLSVNPGVSASWVLAHMLVVGEVMGAEVADEGDEALVQALTLVSDLLTGLFTF